MTCTSVIRPCLSTALTMSISASAPTVTAVSASISTPVRPVTTAVHSTRRASGPSGSMVILQSSSPNEWQSGINSDVRLAPIMPAKMAV